MNKQTIITQNAELDNYQNTRLEISKIIDVLGHSIAFDMSNAITNTMQKQIDLKVREQLIIALQELKKQFTATVKKAGAVALDSVKKPKNVEL
jgi:hypothetical protein